MIPEASVIIPTYSDWHVLQKCLDCLAHQSTPLDRFEVIVANNNPLPEVPSTLKLPSNARVIHVPKPGSYAARNAALREACGDVFFFTDSDCQPDTHWIESGLTALKGLGPIDRIAGAVELFAKGKTWTAPGLYESLYMFNQRNFSENGWAATANLVTRRAAFDLVGSFDENGFSGGDREWGLRATETGSRIVFSQATLIRHPTREDFSEMAKKLRRKIGKSHQDEVISGKLRRSTLSFLFPTRQGIERVMQDERLSQADKARILWIEYRLSLVSFVEYVRLRYLFGSPTRS